MSETGIQISLYLIYALALILIFFAMRGGTNLVEEKVERAALKNYLEKKESKSFTKEVEEALNQVKRPFKNPGYMWATSKVETDQGFELVPFPVLRWWVLFEPRNSRLLKAVQADFLERFREVITNSRIYTSNQYASRFLCDLIPELENCSSTVFVFDEFHPPAPPKKGQKIILFDLSINTGRTANGLLEGMNKVGQVPDLMVFVIANDFVPEIVREGILTAYSDRVASQFKASELAKYWEWRGETTASLIALKEAREGTLDWHDEKVRFALDYLRTLY